MKKCSNCPYGPYSVLSDACDNCKYDSDTGFFGFYDHRVERHFNNEEEQQNYYSTYYFYEEEDDEW